VPGCIAERSVATASASCGGSLRPCSRCNGRPEHREQSRKVWASGDGRKRGGGVEAKALYVAPPLLIAEQVRGESRHHRDGRHSRHRRHRGARASLGRVLINAQIAARLWLSNRAILDGCLPAGGCCFLAGSSRKCPLSGKPGRGGSDVSQIELGWRRMLRSGP
jgi:hypothetical protein